MALDHARVLEEVGGEDRMRGEALRQEFLEEGSILRERRCCTGWEKYIYPLVSFSYAVVKSKG